MEFIHGTDVLIIFQLDSVCAIPLKKKKKN